MHVKAGMMPSELSVSACGLREDTVLSSTPSSCGDFHLIAEQQENNLTLSMTMAEV